MPGSPSGTTGAGRPRQLTPRSRVRAIEVHGACWHGAVPSTNASRVETKVTEAALNPAGTGPPEGRVMPAGAAAAGARGAGRDADGAAGRAVGGACAVLHPAASPAISRPPHTAAKVLFIEITSYEMTPQTAARLRVFGPHWGLPEAERVHSGPVRVHTNRPPMPAAMARST